MKVIDTLVEEHARILDLLALLHNGSELTTPQQRPPVRLFELGLELGRDYLDKLHHFREEYLLFGVLAQKHEGHLDNMIVRHRGQHDLARDLLASIATSLDGYKNGDQEAVRVVRQSVMSYVRAMRAHIRSENEVFFPLAAAALSDTEADVLQDQFVKYEASTAPEARARMEEGLREMAALLA